MKHLVTLLILTASLGALAAPQERRPPLSEDEVIDLLKSSTPRKEILATVNRYGIAFEPTEQALNELRAAGADKTLLAALREAWHPEIIKPLDDKEILVMQVEGVPSETILKKIGERGIGFQPSVDYLTELRSLGAPEALIGVLRAMTPKPFSKEELLQSLRKHEEAEGTVREIQVRGIDFEPSSETLQALQAAGAGNALLEAVRRAKHFKRSMTPPPSAAPAKENPPRPAALDTLIAGKEVSLICGPADSNVPVFAVPDDLGKIATSLRCGEKVTFVERVAVPPGIDKIRYADGKEGFVSNAFLEGSGGTAGGNVTPPVATFQPDVPYTPEARQHKLQGSVALLVLVDAQGNVTEVQETSPRLGDGLDEQAIATVKSWKFKPATQDGIPLPVRIAVEVHFRLRHEAP